MRAQNQMHHFCDAFQTAHGTVSYLHVVADDGRVHCASVYGHASLAPIKQQTIPQLELCAVAFAAKADALIKGEMTLRLERSVFWTDNLLVLQYLSSTERRFHTFVANRVTSILKVLAVGQ